MKRSGSQPPKKFRTQPSAGKVMTTAFLDSKVIILIDFKHARLQLQDNNYANAITQLRVVIKENGGKDSRCCPSLA